MALQEHEVSVLLVEDNPGDARLVEHHLESAVTEQYVDEVSLTHVEDLAAGLDALSAEPFDVLLLDLGLPGSTGIDTLDRVSDADVPVPVVVLTGLRDRQTSVEAIKRGAQDYLPKDELDGERLVRAIRYAIERHEQEEALHRQTEQLAFFNQLLRHDMLNGMNVVRGRAEMLRQELEGDRRENAATIVEWSDDIIDLARKIQSVLETLTDDDQHELHAVDLEAVAETAADRARSKGGEVTVDVPPDAAVRADALLEDVLSNLTMNAVTHGADDRGDVHVHLTAESAGNRVTVRVADDGTGIDESVRDSLFERGGKGASSSGSGFGLYFVGSMVEAYNGDVQVRQSDRGGAAFVLDLPSARSRG